MTDFGALPPEVNSTRLHAGPGAASLLSAAAAWDQLAAELRCAAAACGSAITRLNADWRGPTATRMATAAAGYPKWLSRTAGRAEHAAGQARSAAAAYTAALAATVPPAVVAANRAEHTALSATNIVGQHTAAIAANEGRYADMWSQNAAAMHGYAARAAAATRLDPFVPPPQIAAPGATADPTPLGSALSAVDGFITGPLAPGSLFVIPSTPEFLGIDTLGVVMEGGPPAEADVVRAPRPPAVSAVAGRAGLVGQLSVPRTWSMAAPTIKTAAALVPGSGTHVGAAGSPAANGAGALLSGAATAGLARRAAGGIGGGVGTATAPVRGVATTANIFFLKPGADDAATEGTR